MHKMNRGPQRPTIGQDVKARLDEIAEQLARIEWKIGRSYHGIQQSVDYLGDDIMADFTNLNAKVSAISDIATAVKTMYDGVVVERDAAKAELEALKAADAVDQGAVDEATAKLATAEALLAALTAVTDNTGGSTGGMSTGGVTDPAPTF